MDNKTLQVALLGTNPKSNWRTCLRILANPLPLQMIECMSVHVFVCVRTQVHAYTWRWSVFLANVLINTKSTEFDTHTGVRRAWGRPVRTSLHGWASEHTHKDAMYMSTNNHDYDDGKQAVRLLWPNYPFSNPYIVSVWMACTTLSGI